MSPETTLPVVTLDPATAKALRAASQKAGRWTTERDRLIRVAIEAGASLREIAAAAGLSHTAVAKIGRRSNP